jgi:hypothetical protein
MAAVKCLYSSKSASDMYERPRKIANIIFGVYKQSSPSSCGMWLLSFSVSQGTVGKDLEGKNENEIEKLKLSRVITKKARE